MRTDGQEHHPHPPRALRPGLWTTPITHLAKRLEARQERIVSRDPTGYLDSVRDELPPTAFLHAFSRVAATLSLKDAAADLHLSASAVSRQIQSLEALLGVTLFRRLNPGLEITEQGRRYLDTVNRVLAELRRAQEGLAPPRSGPLRVSALESFTESWLIPHLSDFERTHPGIELQVEATLRYADFDRDPVDVAIRFGTGPWAGLHSEPIVDLPTSRSAAPHSATDLPCASLATCDRTR